MVYDKKICFVHETHIYLTEIKKTFAQSLNYSFSVQLLLRLVIGLKALRVRSHITSATSELCVSASYTSGRPLTAGSA
jgi:hypothetical protein